MRVFYIKAGFDVSGMKRMKGISRRNFFKNKAITGY